PKSRASRRLQENCFRGRRSPSRSWTPRCRSEKSESGCVKGVETHFGERDQFYFHPALGTIPIPSLMVTSRSAGISARVCQIPFGQRTRISAFIAEPRPK